PAAPIGAHLKGSVLRHPGGRPRFARAISPSVRRFGISIFIHPEIGIVRTNPSIVGIRGEQQSIADPFMRENESHAQCLQHLLVLEVKWKYPVGPELYPLLDYFVILRGKKRIEPLRCRQAPTTKIRGVRPGPFIGCSPV